MKKSHVLDLDKIGRRKKIVIQATSDQLKAIKKVLPILDEADHLEELAKGIHQLTLDPISIEVPRLLIQPTMAELDHGATTQIPDFAYSANFYQLAKGKKTFKIIVDEFSDTRNLKLYAGFSLVEQKWRLIIITSYADEILAQTKKPTRSSKYDHQVSLYTTSEFIENFFKKPASEKFIRKKWQASNKTEDTAISLRELTLIDELGFPLTLAELESLQAARNQCMHFRVTTPENYLQIAETMNKYLKAAYQDELSKTFAKSLKPLLEINKTIASVISEIVNSQKMMFPNLNMFDTALESYSTKRLIDAISGLSK